MDDTRVQLFTELVNKLSEIKVYFWPAKNLMLIELLERGTDLLEKPENGEVLVVLFCRKATQKTKRKTHTLVEC